MSSLIFRTMAPLLTILMGLFSIVITLRGHNAPGGGFIGGLIAAAAASLYGLAAGVGPVRRAMRVHPEVIAGAGVLCAIGAGLLSIAFGRPFLTGLWLPGHLFGTPGLFDIGVYLAVFGTITAAVLALSDTDEPT